jgi:CysZ protein
MKAISRHIYAFSKLIQLLAKGEFIVYFIPYALVGLIFMYFTRSVAPEVAADVAEVSKGFFAGIWSWISEKSVSFLAFFLDQIKVFLLLTLLSPVTCILSEKLDNRLTNQKFDGGFGRIITDIFRAIGILIVTLFAQLGVMLVWLIISKILFWVPGIAMINTAMYFAISAFFFGISFYDFSLERYQFSVSRSWKYGLKYKFHMVLTGSIFSAIMLIPLVGIVIAPVLLTMISTIVFLKMNEQKEKVAVPNPDATLNNSQPTIEK